MLPRALLPSFHPLQASTVGLRTCRQAGLALWGGAQCCPCLRAAAVAGARSKQASWPACRLQNAHPSGPTVWMAVEHAYRTSRRVERVAGPHGERMRAPGAVHGRLVVLAAVLGTQPEAIQCFLRAGSARTRPTCSLCTPAGASATPGSSLTGTSWQVWVAGGVSASLLAMLVARARLGFVCRPEAFAALAALCTLHHAAQ